MCLWLLWSFSCLLSILMWISKILSDNSFRVQAQNLHYECGFRSGIIPLRYSVQYWLTGVLIVVFDIEVVLLTPTLCNSYIYTDFYVVTFIVILIIVLGIDWISGTLNWFLILFWLFRAVNSIYFVCFLI